MFLYIAHVSDSHPEVSGDFAYEVFQQYTLTQGACGFDLVLAEPVCVCL